jgi:hypothetical protein
VSRVIIKIIEQKRAEFIYVTPTVPPPHETRLIHSIWISRICHLSLLSRLSPRFSVVFRHGDGKRRLCAIPHHATSLSHWPPQQQYARVSTDSTLASPWASMRIEHGDVGSEWSEPRTRNIGDRRPAIGRSLRIDEAAFEVEDEPLIHVGLGKGKEGGALCRVEKSLPLSHARERDQKADAVTARPALAAAVGAKLQGSDLRNSSSSSSSRVGTRIAGVRGRTG